MARNIVPRSDKGADLGTPTKRWNNVYTDRLKATVVDGDNLGAVEQSAGDEVTLRSLIAAAGSNPTSITIYNDIPITTTDLIIPSNVYLRFKDDGKLSPEAGITLTINGSIEAGLWQIFGENGIVTGNPSIPCVYPEWFGAIGDGVNDDADALQRAVDFGSKLLIGNGTKIYYITKSIYVTHSNFIADFNNAKIKTDQNIRYNIVLVTPDLADYTYDAFETILITLHYGNEIENSHIRNVIIEALPITSSGSNLGIGIVYGKNCTLENILVTQTNGNGIEVRNSTDCTVSNARIFPRAYGFFFFQTKRCTLKDSYVEGCVRGIVIKHSQGGASVEFKAINCTVKNLTEYLYYIVSGTWKENTLTHEIYQPNHELVDDLKFINCNIYSDGNNAKVTLGQFAKNVLFMGCTFTSYYKVSGIEYQASGNADPEFILTGTCDVKSCRFYCNDTTGNSCLYSKGNMIVENCIFDGKYERLLIVGDSQFAKVLFKDNVINGKLLTISSSDKSLLLNGYNKDMNIIGNVINMSIEAVPDKISNAICYSPTLYENNIVKIDGILESNFTHLYCSHPEYSKIQDNVIRINTCNQIIGFYVSGNGEYIIQNNIGIIETDIIGTSILVYMVSNTVESYSKGNIAIGPWESTEIAYLQRNYSINKKFQTHNAAPTNGTWEKGDVIFNISPTAGGYAGWICIADGTPGTWKAFGSIAT